MILILGGITLGAFLLIAAIIAAVLKGIVWVSGGSTGYGALFFAACLLLAVLWAMGALTEYMHERQRKKEKESFKAVNE